MKNMSIVLGCAVLLSVLGMQVYAVCPPEDVTGDCIVNLQDVAALSHAWLTGDGVPADMVPIPAGTFQMGNSKSAVELPVHTVTVDSFAMGKYEITNGQYRDFLNSALTQGLVTVTSGIVYKAGSGTGYLYCDTSTSSPYSQITFSNNSFSVRTKGGKDMTNHPMVWVSWYGSVAYCNWRSQQEGKQICYNLSTWNCDFTKNGYRLPTEAEWEYAARGGGSGSRFPWGDTITHSEANYYSSGSFSYDASNPIWNDGIGPYTSQVGSLTANAYGLYDMAGNVWEWCHDWYGGCTFSSQTNPTGPATGTGRVIRGSGWYYYYDVFLSYYRRGSTRRIILPYNRNYYYGFRVVLNL